MFKIVLGVAFVFTLVYSVYCLFRSVSTRSDEEQVSFYEAFFEHLHILAVCFVVTIALIISFVMIF
jgi:hypothetical protein